MRRKGDLFDLLQDSWCVVKLLRSIYMMPGNFGDNFLMLLLSNEFGDNFLVSP